MLLLKSTRKNANSVGGAEHYFVLSTPAGSCNSTVLFLKVSTLLLCSAVSDSFLDELFELESCDILDEP